MNLAEPAPTVEAATAASAVPTQSVDADDEYKVQAAEVNRSTKKVEATELPSCRRHRQRRPTRAGRQRRTVDFDRARALPDAGQRGDSR